MLLIIFGGIGFLLIREVIGKKFCWRRFSMHTKVVLSMSASLIIVGALLLMLTENISVLGAFSRVYRPGRRDSTLTRSENLPMPEG